MSTKLLLVDHHKIMREGLRSLIESKSDMQVVGEADNGKEAVRLAGELGPDIVIMDINMPEMDGIEATRQITERYAGIKVVALSVYSNRQYVLGMLKAGAKAYILKDNAFRELIEAISVVLRGDTYLSENVAEVVENAGQAGESDNLSDNTLTERERLVLKLLAEGKSSKEIALQINKSPKTIDACRRQIMSKLNVDNLADLIKYAIREGLASLDS